MKIIISDFTFKVFLGHFEANDVEVEASSWNRAMKRRIDQRGIVVGELADMIISRYRLANSALDASKTNKKVLDINGVERERETIPNYFLAGIHGEFSSIKNFSVD